MRRLYAGSTRCAERRRAWLVPEGCARLVSRLKVELENHRFEFIGERGEIFQGFDGFFGALRIFGGELRDLTGRFGNFSRGGGLLGGRGGDELNLVFDLFRRFDGGFEAFARARRFRPCRFRRPCGCSA